MKLESLKSSKFEAFKSNQLLDTINIVGGTVYATSATRNGPYTDCWTTDTKDEIHCTDGSGYDHCPTEPVEVNHISVETTMSGLTYYLGYA